MASTLWTVQHTCARVAAAAWCTLPPPKNPAVKYKDFKTDLAEGVGEVAGVLFRVCKYAYERVSFGGGEAAGFRWGVCK